ncbi:sigma-70 family RNA polymerase sigma factor [Saccharothrix longispora]|uniref:RNA polymerase sigma factor (Sigma-70 family) n=1 Tax=Saccharothrix longispora TaxID=33920 RepID=A0ABU1PVV6_9PSEU|nr:sigma-70 family RNA polymerase sigma factor [Saccharothrix longispora]MDR6594746.1 RNA polymerase sigma factor (sigma-70 family) [Saccharothrix longispora]
MITQPDERDVGRWRTADPVVLRGDLDRALHATAPPSRSSSRSSSRVPSDAELIDAVRAGDLGAYGKLYERHAGAARTFARQLSRSAVEADDLVADSFARVLDVLRDGRGPDSAFRAYLFTAVRHTAYDRHRREKRVQPADDVSELAPEAVVVPFHDPAVAALERALATRAFASLPERWQTVLWQTEIEGQSHAEVAPLLGLTANGVSALAYRAREGLKKAYLQAHLEDVPAGRCRAIADRLGAWTRRGLRSREAAQVEAHLDGCARCRGLAAELADVNGALRAVVAPLVLGVGAAGYLAATAGAAKAAAVGTAAGAAMGGAAAGATAVGTAGAGTAGGTAGAVASAPQWLAVAASTTALVVAVVWGVGSNGGPPEPTTDALPPTLSADLQQPAPTVDSTAPTAAPSGTAPSRASATDSTAPPAPDTSGPARPGASTSGEPPAGPAPNALAPDVPEGFTLGTGGPPADLPVVVRNTGSTPLPQPTLVLSLLDDVRVVGPGEGLLGRPLVALDGAEAQTTVPCPAGSGTVTCTAPRELAPGASVRFVFRLLAGPRSVSGTVTGTVGSASVTAVRVEFPVTVTPKK